MKFTGKLKEPVIDYITGKITALIEINEDFRQAYEELKDYNLDIEIKKYRKKRSLDANAFYWLLISKLAKVLDTSLPELHNLMLSIFKVSDKTFKTLEDAISYRDGILNDNSFARK